jgi:hypothetical protein
MGKVRKIGKVRRTGKECSLITPISSTCFNSPNSLIV